MKHVSWIVFCLLIGFTGIAQAQNPTNPPITMKITGPKKVYYNTEAQFTVTGGKPGYRWRVEGDGIDIVSGENTSTLTVKGNAGGMTAKIQVKDQDGKGDDAEEPATVEAIWIKIEGKSELEKGQTSIYKLVPENEGTVKGNGWMVDIMYLSIVGSAPHMDTSANVKGESPGFGHVKVQVQEQAEVADFSVEVVEDEEEGAPPPPYPSPTPSPSPTPTPYPSPSPSPSPGESPTPAPSPTPNPLPTPTETDSDGDGLTNNEETLQYHTNPNNVDTDYDGLWDGAEIFVHLTDPKNEDTDFDGMSDGWEVGYTLLPLDPSDAPLDPDSDGLVNRIEYEFDSHPRSADPEPDTLPDPWELRIGSFSFWKDAGQVSHFRTGLTYKQEFNDPGTDTDGDGLSDAVEIIWGSNPNSIDSDGDTMPDGWELANDLDHESASDAGGDRDDDGLSNLTEFNAGLVPYDHDSDNDGLGDGFETQYGYNPKTDMANLTSWWRFEEQYGQLIFDSQNPFEDGVLKKYAYLDSGKIGLGLVLQGYDSYVTVADSPSHDLQGAFSISFWIKLEAPPARDLQLIGKKNSFEIGIASDRRVSITLLNDPSQPNNQLLRRIRSGGQIAVGQWTHVVITKNPIDGQGEIYFNGVRNQRATLVGDAAVSDWPLILGCQRRIPNTTPKAILDDLRFYHATLPMATITSLANPGAATAEHNRDDDGDGLTNLDEFLYGGSPYNADTDGDGINDHLETYPQPITVNGQQVTPPRTDVRLADTDGDGWTDYEEIYTYRTNPTLGDTDGDTIWDRKEAVLYGTNPLKTDTDNDQLPDNWEIDYGFDPAGTTADTHGNPDLDPLDNLQEYQAGTHPRIPNATNFGTDTDGDGLSDYLETKFAGTSPTNPDTMGDGLGDGYRYRTGLLAGFAGSGGSGGSGGGSGGGGSGGLGAGDDFDGDGIGNGGEKDNGTDPQDAENATVHVFGMKPVTERPKIQAIEGTNPNTEFDYGSTPVRVKFAAGSEAWLADVPEGDNLLVIDTLVLEGTSKEGGSISQSYAPNGSAKTNPSKHIGEDPANVFEFSSSISVSDFLSQLPADEEGYVSFTVKRIANKTVEWQPDPNPTPTPPPGDGGGGGGGGGGGSGAGSGAPGSGGLGFGVPGRGNPVYGAHQPEEPNAEDDKEVYASSAVVLTVKPGECPCDCQLPGTEPSLQSLHLKMLLGKGTDGKGSGSLLLDSKLPAAILSTPAALKLRAGSRSFYSVRDRNGLRQILSGDALVDIQVISPVKYGIRYFHTSQAGDANNKGVFAVSGSPFATVTIENPDATGVTHNQLKITQVVGTQTTVSQFAYDEALGEWSLITGNGLKREILSTSWNAAQTEKTEIYTITEANGVVVYKERRIYQKFPWGEEMVSRTLDPDGVSRTESWEYYTNPAEPGRYMRLKQQFASNGNWQQYDYDSKGRQIKHVRQFLSNAVGSGDNANRVTTTTYSTENPKRTVVETLLGVEVGRTYYYEADHETREIRCATAGAAWTAADNVVTIRNTEVDSKGGTRLKSIKRPDGTMDIYQYGSEGENRLNTVFRGAPNPAGSAIVSGTKSVTITDSHGRTLASESYDIESGLRVDGSYNEAFDDAGRVIRTAYLDGTFETYTYGCCGLESSTDRAGITTSYLRDAIGRTIAETRLGITTHTEYDAAGNVTKRSREGTDGSLIVQERTNYNVAGEVESVFNALNKEVTTSRVLNNTGAVTTRVFPGGGVEISSQAGDGTIVSLQGSATRPKKTELGVENGSAFTKEIRVSETGAEVEWTKSYYDMLGRVFKKVNGNGVESWSIYNNLGQLVKTIDGDGVTHLFEYDSKGLRTTQVLDMDRDGAIDWAGDDRIEVTEQSVQEIDGRIFSVTTTKRWAETGVDLGVTVLTDEQSVDGLINRHTSLGQTTSTLVEHLASGGKRIRSSAFDGSYQIQEFSSGRVGLIKRFDRDGNVVSSVAYLYDAHGRCLSQNNERTGVVKFDYNEGDQLVSVTVPGVSGAESQLLEAYSYDDAGRQTGVKSSNGEWTYTEYDAVGDIKRYYGAQSHDVRYTYDSQGRRKTMTTSGQAGTATTTWAYQPGTGLLSEKIYEGGAHTGYTYTSAGRSLTIESARGITKTFSYNNAGDLASVEYSDSTPDVSYTYNRLGLRTTVTDVIGTRSFTYRSDDFQIDAETIGGATPKVIRRNYDGFGRANGFDVGNSGQPAGDYSVRYAFDGAGRVVQVLQGEDAWTYSRVPKSDLVASLTRGNAVVTYEYGSANDTLLSVTNAYGAVTISKYEYGVNSIGQRTSVVNSGAAFAAPEFSLFQYNSSGELIKAKRYGGSDLGNLGTPVPAKQYTIEYDGVGNRVAYQPGEANSVEYASDKLNQYSTVDAVQLAYDEDGNLTSDATRVYTWDAENRLSSIQAGVPAVGGKRIEYLYDYLSRMSHKKILAWDGSQWITEIVERYLYDGWNVVCVYDGLATSDLLRTYTWGIDLSGTLNGASGVGGLLLCDEKLGAYAGRHYFCSDGSGNITQVLSSVGALEAHYEYNPFGEESLLQGTYASHNPVRFSTKFKEDETGLINFGRRFYCAPHGRWISRDPLEEEGGTNLYGFVNNDPVNSIDEIGLAPNYPSGNLKVKIDRPEGDKDTTAIAYFELEFPKDRCEVIVNIPVDYRADWPEQITRQKLEKMKGVDVEKAVQAQRDVARGLASGELQSQFSAGLDRAWNDKFKVCCCTKQCPNGLKVIFRLVERKSGNAHRVNVYDLPKQLFVSNQFEWNLAYGAENNGAHEPGHMLGNIDEYGKITRIYNPSLNPEDSTTPLLPPIEAGDYGVANRPGGNIMNNAGGTALARHLWLVEHKAKKVQSSALGGCKAKLLKEECITPYALP